MCNQNRVDSQVYIDLRHKFLMDCKQCLLRNVRLSDLPVLDLILHIVQVESKLFLPVLPDSRWLCCLVDQCNLLDSCISQIDCSPSIVC